MGNNQEEGNKTAINAFSRALIIYARKKVSPEGGGCSAFLEAVVFFKSTIPENVKNNWWKISVSTGDGLDEVVRGPNNFGWW